MAKRTFLAGVTSQTIDIFIQDSSSTIGAGLSGLAFGTSGLTAYYRKGATGTPTAITLVTQTVGGAWSSGGFVELDAVHTKGVYRFDVPDTILASTPWATIYFYGAANMAPVIAELEIVSVNPFDGVRMGLTALPNATAGGAAGLPLGDANARVDVGKWLGTAVSTPTVAGVPNVNTKTWNDLATVALPLIPATAGRSLVVDAAGLADANVVKLGPTGSGTAQTARDVGLNIDATISSRTKPADTQARVTLVDTLTTYTGNTPQTGDAFTRVGAAGAGLTAIPVVARVTLVDTVTTLTNTPSDSAGVTTLLARLTALRAGYLDNLSAGAAALEASLQGLITTIGASAVNVGTAVWSTTVRLLSAGTNIVLAKGVGLTGLNDIAASLILSDATPFAGASIAAIKAKTDNLPSDPADASDIAAAFSIVGSALVALPTAAQNRAEMDSNSTRLAAIAALFTTALTESYNVDGAPPTPAQALFVIMQRLTEFAIVGTTITAKKLDGATTAFTLTIDDATSPTSSTRAT